MAMLAGCASQIPPTGGQKDVTAPLVVKENPANLSTLFHSQKIIITFSEYIQLNDATSQIFFSPALVGKVNYRLRGRSLLISLPDSLRANTTYTVNFGSAIKDITEGNIMLNYQYVFSTGATIDSLRISGKVISALDGKTKPNLLVMLYRDATDSSVALQRPDYNARTDSFGHYTLNHLAGGKYKLFALDDQDYNLMYTQAGEAIAFNDSDVLIADTLGLYNLTMFRPVPEKQAVLGAASRQAGKAIIFLAKRTSHLKVSPLLGSLQVITEYNPTRDTITCWVNDVKSDSIGFILNDDDFNDTVKVRMKGTDTKLRTSSLRLQINPVSRGGRGSADLMQGDPLVLDFSLPVTEEHASRHISALDDSSKKEISLPSQFFTDSMTGRNRARIVYPFKSGLNYRVLIPDSAYSDFFGAYNDTTRIPVRIFSEEDLGTLTLRLKFVDSLQTTSYFYELRNKTNELIAKQKINLKSTTLHFDGLPPGNYAFRVIEDNNDNFNWDTGNYWSHQQPEKIFFKTGSLTIRANWDVEEAMNIAN